MKISCKCSLLLQNKRVIVSAVKRLTGILVYHTEPKQIIDEK